MRIRFFYTCEETEVVAKSPPKIKSVKSEGKERSTGKTDRHAKYRQRD